MKKIITLVFAAACLFMGTQEADSCTNLIVGKKASVDGSVICTYNCDSFGSARSLSYSAPGKHEPGEKVIVPLIRMPSPA